MMRVLLIVSIAAILFGTSCKEKTRVNLISGKVYQDCTIPLSNTEIALKSNTDGITSFSSPIILGSGITAADGTLTFTYELEEEDIGTGSLLLIKSTGFETLISSIRLNTDVNINLYRNDISKVGIQLTGSRVFGVNDTLYYSITGNDETSIMVQPNAGTIDTIHVQSSMPNSTNAEETFYYGIGTAEFIRSKAIARNTDSSFNKIAVNLNGCGTQTDIVLLIN
jgi:hypothetical protein